MANSRFRHTNGDGLLLWASGFDDDIVKEGIYRGTDEWLDMCAAQVWDDNVVTDEGEAWILDAAFRNNQLSGFTFFELILSTSNTLSETSVYADRSELADGNGYAHKQVDRDTTDWSAPTGTTPTSITTPGTGTWQWTATANWSIVYDAAIVTAGLATNRLIAYDDLGGGSGRTLLTNDTLDVDFDINAGGS